MKDLYQKAWDLLDQVTPIPADCGKLCGRRCCKGGKESGMILFPGEKERMNQSFTLSTRVMEGVTVDFAVCKGRCTRSERPLSCRIFPYAPYYEDGVLTVRPDPRAAYLCPLLMPQAAGYIDPAFLAAVEKAFTLLLQQEGFDRFLMSYTKMLRGYERFTR